MVVSKEDKTSILVDGSFIKIKIQRIKI